MISTNFRIITNEFQLDEAKKELDKFYSENGYVEVEARTAKTRTQKQNRALHVWCRHLAETLREKDIDTKTFFKSGFEVPFTPEIVKDNIWKPVQRAVTDKEKSSGRWPRNERMIRESNFENEGSGVWNKRAKNRIQLRKRGVAVSKPIAAIEYSFE